MTRKKLLLPITALLLTLLGLWLIPPLFVPKVSFNADIRPILNKNCLACHGGVKQNGGFSLLFEADAMGTLESGKRAIVPGKPNQSELYLRLLHDDPDLRMPLEKAPLSTAEIQLIRSWIRQGAEWETHWAYTPIEKPEPPRSSSGWAKNNIDLYILPPLEAMGLQPAPTAEKATLLRRASLDLTGLPPTVEQVETFLQDSSPAAYEKALDNLLDSPHFGEHWASLWLDLARYADSQGYEKDDGRTIWRYRDWVIKAFNEDKPFDQFTIEQLAGDQLPDPTRDQLIATAFHRNTMTNTEGGTDDEEFRIAAVIDRINTTFEVWQGTTIGCVQCHSHPYDPFRQKEYYGLMAFFNNSLDNDIDSEIPTLESFEPEYEDSIREMITFIQQLDPELKVDNSALLPHQIEQALFPKLLIQDIDDFENVVFYGRQVASNWNSSVKAAPGKRFFVKFDQVPLDQLQAISFDHWAGGDAGRFIVRLDSRDGAPLVTLEAQKSERSWNYEARKVAVDPSKAKGTHDLIIEFVNTTGKVPDGNLYLKGIELHYSEKESTGAIAEKRDALRQLRNKADHTPIMQSKTPAFSRTTHIFDRGSWLSKGEAVAADIPEILPPSEKGTDPDRLEFARWLVREDNPLTARVIVNRLWDRIYGHGLVKTLEDFGTQGDPPTHPELLDYLAWQFSHDYEWSIKSLLKEILLSATYQQASEMTPAKKEKDPYNDWYSRGARYRLSAEQLRDQVLAVSGLLNDSIGGPSVMPPQPDGVWQIIYSGAKWQTDEEDRYRRGLYTYWKRTTPYPSMVAFDSPSREFCVSRRIRTNTPLQALVTLNDPVYVEAAQALAERMRRLGGQRVEDQIAAGYRLALFRAPSAEAMAVLNDLYQSAKEELEQPHAQTIAGAPEFEPGTRIEDPLSLVANAILNLDAFLTKN